MTVEQIAVYRVFLKIFPKDGDDTLNVANQTEPFDRSELPDDADCSKSLDLEPPPPIRPLVHKLDPAIAKNLRVVLVDPDVQTRIVKENDPQKLMKSAGEGKQVTDKQVTEAVDKAFQTGLLTLSEIIFDKQHRHAFLYFSFFCGRLCGNGGVLILKKTRGKWKLDKECGGWVS